MELLMEGSNSGGSCGSGFEMEKKNTNLHSMQQLHSLEWTLTMVMSCLAASLKQGSKAPSAFGQLSLSLKLGVIDTDTVMALASTVIVISNNHH